MNFLFKNIKTKIILIILITGLPFHMCTSNDDCNCDPVDNMFFDIIGMEIDHLSKNGNPAAIIEEGEQVNFDNYSGFRILYDVDFISCKPKKNYNFSFISSAYACSCLYNGYAGSKEEKLESINVITLNDFDENHLQNTSINDLLTIDGLDLDSYLQNNSENIQEMILHFVLNSQPVLTEEFKVKVVIEFSTGEIYEEITNQIIIN